MRVTDQMMLNNSLYQIQTTQERLVESQAQSASGVKVNLPSDDPSAYGQINSLSQQISQLDGYGQNITLVQTQLQATDSTLQSFQTSYTRLNELALMAANGTGDQGSTATEAQQIYSQLQSLANTQVNGQYLFGGYSTAAPFSGSQFVGDNQKRAVEVSPLGATQFGISAQDAFGVTPGQSAFTSVQNLLTAMQTNNTAGIQAGIGALNTDMTRLATAQTNLGAQLDTLQVAQTSNQNYLLNLQQAQSSLKDTDPAQAYSQLAADQYASQATFSTIASTSKISLLNYL